MPVHLGNENGKCYAQWGGHGAKYEYTCGDEAARKRAEGKATAQGQAAHANGYAAEKVSFDYDGTLTLSRIQDKAKALIAAGIDVYIISARHEAIDLLHMADRLGIPHSRVYATGSNTAKEDKVKSLGISKHYDNNPDVVNKLQGIGHLVQMTIHERFAEMTKFLGDD